MPLEVATTIDQLAPLNPAHTDSTGVADSHLRLIKAAILGTFPGITGVLASTTAQIDANRTSPARLTALESGKLGNTGGIINGNLTITGTTNTGTVQQAGSTLVPPGTIVMWNGATAPAGWVPCDGTGGSPDLRDRFVIARGPATAGGFSGGLATSGAGVGVNPVAVLLFIMKL